MRMQAGRGVTAASDAQRAAAMAARDGSDAGARDDHAPDALYARRRAAPQAGPGRSSRVSGWRRCRSVRRGWLLSFWREDSRQHGRGTAVAAVDRPVLGAGRARAVQPARPARCRARRCGRRGGTGRAARRVRVQRRAGSSPAASKWISAQVERCLAVAVPEQDFPPRQIELEAHRRTLVAVPWRRRRPAAHARGVCRAC